ncbi:NifU family protein, partial [Bilophila wadsworthia]
DGHRVVVALRGLCSNCSSRTVTLKDLVEKILREQVEPEIVVEEVKA